MTSRSARRLTAGGWSRVLRLTTLVAVLLVAWVVHLQAIGASATTDEVPDPFFWVEPDANLVGGAGWLPATEVVVLVGDVSEPEYEGSTQSEPSGEFVLDLSGTFDIQPGHIVTVIVGDSSSSHVVSDLTVTDVDRASSTVSGTAPPESDVVVEVDGHDDTAIRVASDDQAEWTAATNAEYPRRFSYSVEATGSEDVTTYPDIDFTWTVTTYGTETWVRGYLGSKNVSNYGYNSYSTDYLGAPPDTVITRWDHTVYESVYGGTDAGTYVSGGTMLVIRTFSGGDQNFWGTTYPGTYRATYRIYDDRERTAIRTVSQFGTGVISADEGTKMVGTFTPISPAPQQGGTVEVDSREASFSDPRVQPGDPAIVIWTGSEGWVYAQTSYTETETVAWSEDVTGTAEVAVSEGEKQLVAALPVAPNNDTDWFAVADDPMVELRIEGPSLYASTLTEPTRVTLGPDSSGWALCYDTNGNATRVAWSVVDFDTTLPEIAVDSDDYIEGEWSSAPVRLSVATTDNVSGIASVSYGVFEASVEATRGMSAVETTTSAEVALHLGDEGEWRAWIWAEDAAGNVGTATFDVSIDMSSPDVSTTFNPEEPDGEQGWYVTAPTISIIATDSGSGVDYIEWRVSDGGWQREHGALVTIADSPDGEYTLSYCAADVAGNVEETHTVSIQVDTQAPVTSVSVPKVHVTPMEVTLEAIDAVSGVAATYHRIDGAAEMTYADEPILFEEPGTYTLEYWSIDVAGNQEVTRSVTLDVLAPVVEIQGPTRFETAVMTSQEVYPDGLDPDGAKTVLIATGSNWPDALGGSSLAGVLDGPVLLTRAGSLPGAVTDEIDRLGATKAIILGGTAAVGTDVEAALKTLLGNTNVERIAGNDRYKTADAVAERVISLKGGSYDGKAFVATGGNFPDALAAAPLAAAKHWPLYLAHPTRGITAGTQTAMTGVSEVLVLGGTAVVSQPVEDYLKATYGNTKVHRLAGANRFATAVVVATYGVQNADLGWNRVGIATGENFPDALAGGVLQGKQDSVMLLTRSGALSTPTHDALAANKAAIDSVTFFGGTSAVSTAVRTAVANALE